MTWTTGYEFGTRPDEAATWEDLRDGFAWDVPGTYNVADAALADAALDGDADAVALEHVDGDGGHHRFGYGDLRRATDRLAAGLASTGVGRGDRVGVCLPQCPEHLLVHLATYRLGAVVVPLSMLLGGEALTYALEHSGASTLFVDRRRHETVGDLPDSVESTVVVETGDGYRGLDTPVDASPDRTLGGLSDAVDARETPDVDPVETTPDDPALVLYTSGTSGDPKGVLVGHEYLVGSLPAFHCYFHLFDAEAARSARVWTPSEWAWAGALFDVVFPTLALGGTVASRERRSGFDPDGALSFVDEVAVTHAFLPPTALGRIRTGAHVGDHDCESLSVVMCGGEQLSPTLFRWAEDALDVTVNESYGQTEANGLVSNCQAAFEVEAGSMGRPVPGHDVAVLDDDGNELPPNERGELAVRSPDPVLLAEYWRDRAATARKFTDGVPANEASGASESRDAAGSWFLTGDLVRRDENGRLWHQGRVDDLIVTSGYRVSPLEVEQALAGDPAVADVVVGGVPDEARGERVTAYVVLGREGTASDDLRERLRRRVREALGAHKVPREIAFVESLPETRSGKADRVALFESS